MTEKTSSDCLYSFPRLSVSIEEVTMLDGKVMFNLVILHLDGHPYVDKYFQTYNGAIIGLFRFLSNSIAAV